jgi:GNAT superfamily N-acetyltransferase
MIQIRLSNEYDAHQIIDFQLKMAYETEGISLNKDIVKEGVMSVYNDPVKGKYYVAEETGKIVGSLLITTEWSDWRNCWNYWIQSVYVIPEKRGDGVFTLLYNHIKEEVSENSDIAGLKLYVDKSNTRAKKVYTRLGMNGDHYQLYEWMK